MSKALTFNLPELNYDLVLVRIYAPMFKDVRKKSLYNTLFNCKTINCSTVS